MPQKKCKYCERELPDDYQYEECENCRAKNAKNLKNKLLLFFAIGSLCIPAFISQILNSKEGKS